MDALYLILIVFGVGAACAGFITYKVLKKKYDEKNAKLESIFNKRIIEEESENEAAISSVIKEKK
ncbi:hypothetical protein AB9Q52_017400 [Pantoea vagans]|uniref:hypothetical protein n=1 Tax=Pantoea vagans TaxID=470934 RepID=UPI0035128189